MARTKKNKYPVKTKRIRHEGPINVKLGVYDGASSDDFVVSGHSMGSQSSEMDELSQQLSRDVGNIPEYPVEFSGRSNSDADGEFGEYNGYEGEGLGDLGGPEFYGNKPSLLKKSPIHFANETRRLSISTSIAAFAGSAVLAGIAYAIYRNVRATDSHARSATRTTGAAKSASKSGPSAAASKVSVRASSGRATASKAKRSTKAPRAKVARGSKSQSQSARA